MGSVAIVVDWMGPFASIDQARSYSSDKGLGEVIYFALGRTRYQRSTRLQYIGISNNGSSRFTGQHRTLPEIRGNFALWIGVVASHGVTGRDKRRPIRHSLTINLAEWMLAYFLGLPLNVRKRRRPPNRSAVLINRWFQIDAEKRRVQRAHSDWPDYIEYEKDARFARLQWFGTPGKHKRLSEQDIANLSRQL